MVNNKSGISAIVATVLIILITVAAVTIIWAAIIPMIQDNLASTEQFDVRLNIETASGYTVWDAENNLASVQVRRGADDVNVSQAQIIFVSNGKSDTFYETAPNPNQAKTYYYRLSEKPEEVKVAPITYSEREKKVGEIISKGVLSKGKIDSAGKSIKESDGRTEDLECKDWDSETGSYSYWAIGIASRSGNYYCDGKGDYGECGIDNNCPSAPECFEENCNNLVCENVPSPIDTSCSAGFCDGNGNCGECNYVSDCADINCKSKSCESNECVYQNSFPCTVFFEDFELGQIWEHNVADIGGVYCGEKLDSWAIFSSSSGGSINFGSNWAGVPGQLNRECESSYIKSPLINLIDATTTTLTFNSWTNDEGGCPSFDTEYIEVSNDGGDTWTTISGCPEDLLHNSYDTTLRTFTYNLNDYTGQEIKIRFRYDTWDDCCGLEEGWYIDDVDVTILS